MQLYAPRPLPADLPRWWGTSGVLAPLGAGTHDPGPARPSRWLAVLSSVNLLDDGLGPLPPPPAEYEGCRRLVVDSGRLRGEGEPQLSALNWGPRAHHALHAACARLAPQVQAQSATLCLRPRVGDVLSDVPSILSFLRTFPEGLFEILLDPSALLAGSMLDRAEDHLDRIVSALLEHPFVPAVAATNIALDDAGLPVGAPLHRGSIDPRLVVRVAERAVAAGKPIVLHPEDLPGQVHLLGGAAAV